QLSWFLLSRGVWLLFLELTAVRLGWTFNFDWHTHGGGVIWAIGWSMVVLSGLVFFPVSVVATFGIMMIGYHNLLDNQTAGDLRLPEWLWSILHQPGDDIVVLRDQEGVPITFGTGYKLIPWIGVMAAGYGFGSLFLLEPAQRRKQIFGLGVMLTLAFVLLRWSNLYGDPQPWMPQERGTLFSVFSFLNCTKYPPSLLYLLMTLGPALMFLALVDGLQIPLTRPLVIFGRVPLFYYLLHIP